MQSNVGRTDSRAKVSEVSGIHKRTQWKTLPTINEPL